MKIGIGADHAGFELKQALAARLRECDYDVVDLGAYRLDPGDDYVDYAVAVGRAVTTDAAQRGIVICGSGVGVTVAANKVEGVRACLCHDTYSARQGVEHDDMNVLVLGGRVIGPALAEELVLAFLRARFSGEERHIRRLSKIKQLEAAWAAAGRQEGKL
jgi:ribose 5-phosphate isomerase B